MSGKVSLSDDMGHGTDHERVTGGAPHRTNDLDAQASAVSYTGEAGQGGNNDGIDQPLLLCFDRTMENETNAVLQR